MLKLFKKIYFFVFLVLFSGICFSETSTGDITELVGEGIINYSTGRVRATGIGAPPENAQNMAQKRAMAKRAAVVVARRNLLEVVKGVRIDSETIVENFVTQSDIIKTQISGFVENSQEVAVKEYPDGSVEVTVEMPLRGQVTQSLLKNLGSNVPVLKTDETQAYTGLIVDCTGLGIRPAMSPKILNEEKKEIYGSAYVTEEFAIQQGMAGYLKSVDAAKENDRVGKNPMIIKGLKTEGSMQANVIINNSDAESLKKINETHTFLRQCRVIFVI